MPVIDHKWLEGDAGSQILHSVRSDKRLKSFGILEKPTLAAPYTLYDEASFKVVVLGNAFCGKTSFLEAICQRKTSAEKNEYIMTPGIQISHLYWPCKMADRDKFVMFNLGKLAALLDTTIQFELFQ